MPQAQRFSPLGYSPTLFMLAFHVARASPGGFPGRAAKGEHHPETLTSIFNLGILLKKLGRLEEAEALVREAAEKSRSLSVVGDGAGASLSKPMTSKVQPSWGTAISRR